MRENYHSSLQHFRKFLRWFAWQQDAASPEHQKNLRAIPAFLTALNQQRNSMLNAFTVLLFGLLFTVNTVTAQCTPPVLVGASNISPSMANINWVRTTGETYTLEVYTNATYSAGALFNSYTGIAAGSYTVDGLTTGATYYYRIKVDSTSGCTSYTTGSFSAQYGYTPLDVTGFTQDVIAEGTGYASTKTSSLGAVDSGNYAYMVTGYKATSGGTAVTNQLPVNRTINGSGVTGLTFMMQPYEATNNSLRLNTASPSGTLTLTKPVSADYLYIVQVAGESTQNVNILVTFTDNSTQTATAIPFTNWDNTPANTTLTPIIVSGLRRVSRTSNAAPETGTGFQLFQGTIAITAANQTKSIASITFSKPATNSQVPNVFAVSAHTLGTCPSMTSAAATAASYSSVNLSWVLNNAGQGFTSAGVTYTVETYSDAAYSTLIGTPVTGITGSTYSVTGLSPFTQYYFRVKAVNTSCSSGYATATATTPYAPCATPEAPASVAFSAISSSNITATVTAASTAPTGYLIVRSLSSSLSAAPVTGTTYAAGNTLGGGTVVAFSTSLTATNFVAANTRYYFYVYAYNNTTCAGPVYSAATTGNTTTCATAAVASAASNVKNSFATLNWASLKGTNGNPVTYNVELYSDSGLTNVFGTYTLTDQISYDVTGLTANTTYYYRLKASLDTGCGDSAYSSTISFKAENNYSPINLTGFNADVIGEGNGFALISTTSDVDGGGYVYMSRDYKPNVTSTALTTGALPVNRTMASPNNTGLNFLMPDYKQNNVVRLTAATPSQDLVFSIPTKLTNIYLAVTSGGAASSITGTIYFSDDTTQAIASTSVPDWFSAPTTQLPALAYNIGRVLKTGTNNEAEFTTTTTITGSNAKIFQLSIDILAANQAKKVTKVTVNRVASGNGIPNIFAISGKVIGDCPTLSSATAVAAGSSSATVSWVLSAAGDGGTPTYTVETYSDSAYTTLVGTTATGITGTSYTVSGLTANTTYYFKVKATNAVCESNYATASVTTAQLECIAPDAPTLAITGATASTVTGTISAPATAPSGYIVIRSTSATLTAAPVNLTTYTTGTAVGGGTVVSVGTATALNNTTVNANTLYYYFVYTYNTGTSCSGPIYSATAATASATTCIAQTYAVGASNIKNSSATLNWTSVSGGGASAVTYNVDVATDSNFTNLFVTYTGLTGSTKSISGLNANTTYYYRVISSASGCPVTYSTKSFTAQNGFTPIDVTSGGYNQDVIANGSGAAHYSTTAPVDAAGAGNAYVALNYVDGNGVATTTGLPVNRFLPSTSTTGLNFIIPDYSGNNCLRLPAQNDTGTLTFETPVKLTDLYIATTGGSGSGLTATAEIMFTDGGTSQVTTGISIPDWVGGTGSIIINNLGRANMNDTTGGFETSATKIFQVPISISADNQTRKVASVKFTKTSTGATEPVLNIFAISGKIIGDCPTLNTATATATTYSTANFTWALSTPGDGYTAADVSYKIEVFTNADFTGAVTGSPFTTSAGATSYTVSGLSAVTTYYYKVTAINSSCESNFVSGSFVTPVSCPAPTNVTSVSGFTTATVSWTGTSAGSYDYYYSTTNTAPTAATAGTSVTSTSVTLTTPANVTNYVWVRAHCSDSDKSTWVSGGSFATGAYCSPSYTNSCNDTHRITQVAIPQLSLTDVFASGTCSTGRDRTATQLAVTAGQTYTFNISTIGWMGVGVAADFDVDGTFSSANETLALSNYIVSEAATYALSVTIPASVPTGQYRLRIWNRLANAGTGSPVDSPCGTYTGVNVYGTWADYTLSVTAPCYTWNGSADTVWTNTANWCGGVIPSATSDVTIAPTANNPVISTGIAHAHNLTVGQGATLTVAAGATLSVENILSVHPEGTLTVSNNGALLQATTATANTNVGKITIHKNSNPLYRLDYTMWSSPVDGQNLALFSPATSTNRFYEYKYALNSSNEWIEGYWPVTPGTTNFAAAKGYLIRMPNSISTLTGYAEGTASSVLDGTFTGTPNNGTVNIDLSILHNRYTAVGNPYPSPISVSDFFAANSTKLYSATGLYLWRKRNNSASSSYATLTQAGYVANPDDATTSAANIGSFYQGAASTWMISQGQGFIVRTVGDNFTTAPQLTFTNSMRRAAQGTSQGFFKSAQSTDSKLWLNLTAESGSASQAMVAYMEAEGTPGLDYGYDGLKLTDGNTVALYSLAESTPLAIQARPGFNAGDVVPMGFAAPAAGQYTISLDHTEGVFSQGQAIYLRDNAEGIIRNMGDNNYSFTTEAGTFEGRFDVIYTTTALGTDNPVIDPNTVVVYKQGNTININTGTAMMNGVTIFDIRGRQLYNAGGINATETAVSNLNIAQQVIIVEIDTVKGKVSKRIVF